MIQRTNPTWQGQVGLKDQFNQSGEIKLRQGSGRVPVSPLEAAFAIGFVGTFGALAVIKLREEGVTDAEAALAYLEAVPAQFSEATRGVEWGPVGVAGAAAALSAARKAAVEASKAAGSGALRLSVL